LYVGPLIASARHTHHAGQVMWVPGALSVEDDDGVSRHVTAHLVPPDRPHSHGASAAAAVLWVDRDDLQWERALRTSMDVSRERSAIAGARLDEQLAPEEAARSHGCCSIGLRRIMPRKHPRPGTLR
jgi:hypothetical protein